MSEADKMFEELIEDTRQFWLREFHARFKLDNTEKVALANINRYTRDYLNQKMLELGWLNE